MLFARVTDYCLKNINMTTKRIRNYVKCPIIYSTHNQTTLTGIKNIPNVKCLNLVLKDILFESMDLNSNSLTFKHRIIFMIIVNKY